MVLKYCFPSSLNADRTPQLKRSVRQLALMEESYNLGFSYMDETTLLFRPVGQEEFELVQQSQFTAFPPRLPEQPIFYPVLNEEYATQIARDWNAKHNREKVGLRDAFLREKRVSQAA